MQVSVFPDESCGTGQLLQSVQGPLGLSLLNHAHRAVQKNDHANDGCIVDFPQKQGNGRGHHQNKDQGIVQLFQKDLHRRLPAAFYQNILSARRRSGAGRIFHRASILSCLS